ncbi:glycine receptor subunit alpha-2-like [Tubulanus polymorphus]|uniref:glycine receptor subunit alpha-2-like n=1 Tax=Tubulanus polymorphus TaxID=672921 RepID=UPI003DA3D2FE
MFGGIIAFLIASQMAVLVMERGVGATENASVFMENLMKNYNKKVRPFADEEKRLDVSYKLHINSIGSISAMHSEFSMDFILQQSWVDPRFKYDSKVDSPDHDLEFGYERFGDIWVPDTHIKNAKSAGTLSVTVPNVRLTIEPSGQIHYSQRLTARMSCKMDLHFYPFDTQTCGLALQPFGHTSDHVNVMWADDNPVEFEENFSVAEFDFKSLRTTYKNCSRVFPFSGGHFSCVSVYFTMDRDYGFYILSIIVPTALVIFAAWASMWVDVGAVPARTAIALICLMTISTKSSGLLQHLPRVTYVKVVDVWIVGTLTFVIISFVEFVLVNALNRRQRKFKEAEAKRKRDYVEKPASPETKVEIMPPVEPSITGTTLENAARVIYPLLFLLFNVIFWLYAFKFFESSQSSANA